MEGDKSKNARKSILGTVLIFLALTFFIPEILTGSTPVESPFLILVVLFYGLQVMIIADIRARYKLGWSTVYIIGLIYGIFEEGFADFTMESAAGPGSTFPLMISGVNATWTVFIMMGHAIVSVLCTIFIINVIWPEKISEPFLKKKHYLTIIPIIFITYLITIAVVDYTRHSLGGILAVTLLGALCLVLYYLAKRSTKPVKAASPWSVGTYAKYAALLGVLTLFLPFIIGKPADARGFLLIYLIILAYAFWLFFKHLDADSEPSNRKIMAIFSAFLIIEFLVGFIGRDPLSDIVAVIGTATELYVGWKAVRR